MQLYQVDAFTSRLFGGNPAAVVPLESWPADDIMQAIAAENNLAETAFFVPEGSGYHLRWFTPELEIDLCGHATLATAHVLYEHLGATAPELRFKTRSGTLTVVREGDWLAMDFPARPPEPRPQEAATLSAALALATVSPVFVGKSRDYLVELPSEQAVRNLRPRMDLIAELDCVGVIATAPGNTVDFVSRFFAPQAGVPEDPVTGSAHSTLIPYWAGKLGQFSLDAWQVSPRHGELRCTHRGERVIIAGQAVTYLVGQIQVP